MSSPERRERVMDKLYAEALQRPGRRVYLDQWREAIIAYEAELVMEMESMPEDVEIAIAALQSYLLGRAESHIADCDRCKQAHRTLAKLEAMANGL